MEHHEIESENIQILLMRYLDGEIDPSQSKKIEEWIEKSKEHRRTYEILRKLMFLSDFYYTAKRVDTEKALRAVHRRVRQKTFTRKVLKYSRYAALLLLPLLLSLFIYRQDRDSDESFMLVKTNPGMCATFILPDSTQVVLNSESSLRYPLHFSRGERRVELDGEAFFNVKKNAKQRFVVQTPCRARVVVYGTQFNLDAYKKGSTICATLLKGRVGFEYKNRSGELQEVFLSPHQKVELDLHHRTTVVSSTSGEVETAWKEGRMVFRNTPLRDILHVMEKRYHVHFVVKDPSLYSNSFTGSFESQRVEEVLEFFNLSSKMRWRIVPLKNKSLKEKVIEIYVSDSKL